MNRAIALSALLLGGCSKDGSILSFPDLSSLLPTVRVARMEVTGIDFTRVDTAFVLEVDNPHPIGVSLDGFSWRLAVDEAPFLSGDITDGLTVGARGKSEIPIPIGFAFTDLPMAISALTGPGAPFTFQGTATIPTPLGSFPVPFQHEGVLPVLRTPTLGFAGVRLGTIDLFTQSASLMIDLVVAQDNASALQFTGFDYGLTVGGSRVVEGTVPDVGEVPGGGQRKVSLPIKVNLLQVGTSIANAIRSGGKVPVALTGTVQVGTPFGPVPWTVSTDQLVQVLK